MKNLLAFLLAFVSAFAFANDEKPRGNQPISQKAEASAQVAWIESAQQEFIEQIKSYVYNTFEAPARAISQLNKPAYQVRVYDMSGTIIYTAPCILYAELPAGAELLTIYGNVAYFLVVQ